MQIGRHLQLVYLLLPLGTGHQPLLKVANSTGLCKRIRPYRPGQASGTLGRLREIACQGDSYLGWVDVDGHSLQGTLHPADWGYPLHLAPGNEGLGVHLQFNQQAWVSLATQGDTP